MAQVPYEFLARFDHQTGVLKGAHCKLFDSVTGKEGNAQAVAVAGAQGFPLSDILTQIETGAILAMEEARANLAAEQAAHATTKAELDSVKAELAASAEVIAAYQAAQPVQP